MLTVIILALGITCQQDHIRVWVTPPPIEFIAVELCGIKNVRHLHASYNPWTKTFTVLSLVTAPMPDPVFSDGFE